MARRKFAALTLCILGLCSVAVTSVRAQEPFIIADGCALLGELVVNQLTLKRWFGNGGSGPLLSNPGQIDITICNQTARTVTAAFTSALAEMNIGVSWGGSHSFDGVACLSADLSQCYPERFPFFGGASGDLVFIRNSWRAVQRAVAGNMPLGMASDMIRFSASGFGATLERLFEDNTSAAAFNLPRTMLSR